MYNNVKEGIMSSVPQLIVPPESKKAKMSQTTKVIVD